MQESGEDFPNKSVVLTFDDGYENNYEHAYKILKKFGYSAVIFVPSDKVGEKDFLTKAQIKEMTENSLNLFN